MVRSESKKLGLPKDSALDLVMTLRVISQCLQTRNQVSEFKSILNKIEKCCQAVDQGFNLADVINDADNYESLIQTMGPASVSLALQLILKLALPDHQAISFSVDVDFEVQESLDWIQNSQGNWASYDLVLSLDFGRSGTPEGLSASNLVSVMIVNPRNLEHWRSLQLVPRGALVSIFILSKITNQFKNQNSKRNLSLERQTALRFKDLFHSTLRDNQNLRKLKPTLVRASSSVRQPVPKSTATKQVPRSSMSLKGLKGQGAPLAVSFQTLISKADTFVHAGNAHLIVTHLATYSGRVELFVARGHQKSPVALDTDSIWSAEIRNGETVVYDFYGPSPSDDFLKELVKRTNKYTQMDKVSNE